MKVLTKTIVVAAIIAMLAGTSFANGRSSELEINALLEKNPIKYSDLHLKGGKSTPESRAAKAERLAIFKAKYNK